MVAPLDRQGNEMQRSGNMRMAIAVVALVAVTPLLAGCDASRVGARCRSGFARDNSHVLTCRNGRWARLMTFGEYLSLLQRLQKPDIRAIDFQSATLPAGSCNFGSWQSRNPIRLDGGSGNSDTYSPASGGFSGVSVNGTNVVGYADVDGDGSEEAVLAINCAGSPVELCCAGRSSLLTFAIAVRRTGDGLRLVGEPIVGLPISGAESRIAEVRLEGSMILTRESVIYPETDGNFPDQVRRYRWSGTAWQAG